MKKFLLRVKTVNYRSTFFFCDKFHQLTPLESPKILLVWNANGRYYLSPSPLKGRLIWKVIQELFHWVGENSKLSFEKKSKIDHSLISSIKVVFFSVTNTRPWSVFVKMVIEKICQIWFSLGNTKQIKKKKQDIEWPLFFCKRRLVFALKSKKKLSWRKTLVYENVQFCCLENSAILVFINNLKNRNEISYSQSFFFCFTKTTISVHFLKQKIADYHPERPLKFEKSIFFFFFEIVKVLFFMQQAEKKGEI